MDYMSSASVRFADSGPLAPSLLCRPVFYHMWQPHVTVSQSLPARLHRPGTERQRESSLCFLTCCTRLTFGIFLGDLNNSHAGNSPSSFLMPFPVCDGSLYYGETSNIPKMSHCSCRAGKRLQSAGGSAKEELNMSTLTLSRVCGLNLNATL